MSTSRTAGIQLAVLFVLHQTVGAQSVPRPAAFKSAPSQSAHLQLKPQATLPGGCPDYSGVLSAVGVPVGSSQVLYVVSGTAPDGGYTWNVYSSDNTIATAGNTTGGFSASVYTPAGSTVSGPFTVYGVHFGEAALIIQEVSPGSGSSSTPMTAWAVNPTLDSYFVDANFPYNTCRVEGTPNFSTDPSVLSSCGGSVLGTAADGVSQLLLRVQAGLTGTACYSITSTSSLDQGTINSAVVPTQSVGSSDYGFSYYTAPSVYGDTSTSRDVQVQFAFAPTGNSNTTVLSSSLTVIRPPVVLIHGLWSNKDAWPSFWYRSGPYFTSAADYAGTNASSFSVNYPNVQNFVADGLNLARDNGYAATQADVVAHSMGGILTRLYAGSSAFRRPDNLNMGDVRRLVTLDTPHAGASTANLIVSMEKNSATFRVLGAAFAGFGSIFNSTVLNVQNGAVCDLAENSPALEGVTATSLPSQTITATGGPAGTPTGGPYSAVIETLLTSQVCLVGSFPFCLVSAYVFPQDVVNGFRFRQANDTIVPLSSQQGGLAGLNYSNYIHTSVNTANDVANQTFTLLDGQASVFSSSLPAVSSNGLGNPLTVPGRGVTLDQADYASQCIGSSVPLKPLIVTDRETVARSQNSPRGVRPQVSPSSQIQISSPANGQNFTPGQAVSITVQVSSPLTLAGGFVAVSVPGIGALTSTSSTSNSFQTSFVIPSTFAGPAVLTPAILDVNSNPVLGVSTTINVVPPTAPTSLTIAGGNYVHLTSSTATANIYVTGNYPGNVTLDLTSPVTGTTYSSSNSNVLTVSTAGVVQAVSFGNAVVTVRNQGVSANVTFVVESGTAALPPQDLTSSMNVSVSGFQLNRNTGFYVQTVTITNALQIPATGPLYFVLNSLTTGVTLSNPGYGLTKTISPVGSPYLKLQLSEGLTLQPGASVSMTLQFLNPSRARISYSPAIVRTLATP
jgi:pimeloyl-ACP methyl ester carboxylesterase